MPRFHRWKVIDGDQRTIIEGDWLTITGTHVVAWKGGGNGIEATTAVPVERGYRIKHMEKK